MIKKLKIKFICLAMVSLFLLLTIVVAGMNIINYNSVVAEADRTLEFMSQNKGGFPDFEPGGKGAPLMPTEKPLPEHMSPETPYESRYFSVLITDSGEVLQTETSRIASIDEDTAKEYALKALNSKKLSGFADEFRYAVSREGEGWRITFLNCGRNLDSFYRFLCASVGMAAAGFLLISLIISFFANRFVRPVAQSYEKQRQFITDAGHELKTPLTIINANVDILEMDIESNECLADIRQQTERLTTLTNDLVYLARLEEAEKKLKKIELPISELVSETAESFRALAQTRGIKFVCNVEPMLSAEGDFKSLQQLVCVLTDNAGKYTTDGGVVEVSLAKQSKYIRLKIFNTTAQPVNGKELQYVFDRFYRSDPSRNSETGGHGIGLSVAKAIVEAHNGKIKASTPDEKSFEIIVHLPL
ncbi:MAG: HAMP domain-containing histidine kinase [Clostridia bacterium]|nr:HAMP domain-containing histidine kinase [Clostridia bacterium]